MDKTKRKSVTMADIAGALGISKNAVSLALNDKPGVSDLLRIQVREMAEQMQYGAPSPLPQRDDRLCIVVLVPEYIRDDSFFYSEIFWSIEHETRKIGYLTLTCGLSTVAECEGIMPAAPDTLEVLGYLAIGIIRETYLEALKALGKPVVSVDIRPQRARVSSVGSDNIRGGFMATQHLLDAGHTQIGFVGPVFTAQSVYERWCGFQQAMLCARLPIEQDHCIWGARDRFELLDHADILAQYVDRITYFPTAWFCAGDLIAVSLTVLLAARGLRVPQDLSIVGFDDLKVAELVTPPLSTIHVDRKQMGKTAVWRLLEEAQNPQMPAMHLALTCELVTRQSVCRRSVNA